MEPNNQPMEPKFPHLEEQLREAKKELSFLNETVIPYMRQHGFTPGSGTMNWASIKQATCNRDFLPDLPKRNLKFEQFLTFKGYAVTFNEDKFMEAYNETPIGRERLVTMQNYAMLNSAHTRIVINEEVL